MQQQIIATLRSCLPIYEKLSKIPGYELNKKELGRLDMFYGIWETGVLDDERVLAEAGIPYEIFGTLVGFASEALKVSGDSY